MRRINSPIGPQQHFIQKEKKLAFKILVVEHLYRLFLDTSTQIIWQKMVPIWPPKKKEVECHRCLLTASGTEKGYEFTIEGGREGT